MIPSNLVCPDESRWHELSFQALDRKTLTSPDLEINKASLNSKLGKLNWLSMESFSVRGPINDAESIYSDLIIKLYFKVYGN